ncbi:hypothetical protein CNMCM5793_005617 [Aspergillus hiratsukae]|uniref:Uncharacterized protein n=1 Tax=Aspergillus hiratsukae TaxID=1194566 RepID=A0A8H6PGD4_9EURO|nr:hypothetical protein CNMCM5793_005617 [Aspergillus hiratsukae]KAF7166570.1 hypothetical protein CNMCM6106_002345 [Aspergillus hiratsukae]
MTSEILSEGVKQIIGTMRELIENKIAIKEKKVEGDVWKYSGEEFLSEVSKLENEMRKQGANVEQCNAYHCVRGANIHNLTGRLFLIPVNGTPTLTKGGPLLPGSRYFFEGQPSKEKEGRGIPLVGDGIDIVIVVLK